MSEGYGEFLAAAAPIQIPAPAWSGVDIPGPWGHFTIHAYALCILAGVFAALWMTQRRLTKRAAPEGALWDIALWAIPCGILGGRLYHVVTSPDLYFGPGYNGTGNPAKIFSIWEGGLGIWGAVVFGVLGAWIGCRRSKMPLSLLLDAAAPGLLLAQAIGRWGNYFNQELFGGPTTLPWGLVIDPNHPNFPSGYGATTLFHPTFFYESLWNLLGVFLLLSLDRHFRFRLGQLFALYAMYYSFGRIWIEMLRIDRAQQLTMFGITERLNVFTAAGVFCAALLAFLILSVLRSRSAMPTDQQQTTWPQENGRADPTTNHTESVPSHGTGTKPADVASLSSPQQRPVAKNVRPGLGGKTSQGESHPSQPDAAPAPSSSLPSKPAASPHSPPGPQAEERPSRSEISAQGGQGGEGDADGTTLAAPAQTSPSSTAEEPIPSVRQFVEAGKEARVAREHRAPQSDREAADGKETHEELSELGTQPKPSDPSEREASSPSKKDPTPPTQQRGNDS